MKKTLLAAAFGLSSLLGASAQAKYEPTEANLKSREEFRDMKLGIFLHWGIYSTFAQGEWYLQNAVPDRYEYAKAADAFYPHRFDARQWVRSFKEAGALFQRNIGSLEGLYGEAVSARAKALSAHNLYDTQGTDLHNESYARFFDSFGFCV
jgi:hypothetical protein